MTEHRGETAEALLDAAEGLFSDRGYAAVSIREISERAAANVAAISYHFGSKRELYLETVRRAMSHGEADSAWSLLQDPPAGREEAADRLAGFIRGYLQSILGPDRPAVCGTLMLWEAIRPSDAIDAVVRDYIRPGQQALVGLVRAILPPTARAGPEMVARSILAQILHERIFQPFIERLEGQAPADRIELVADHILRFSLQGMGCDARFVQRVATAAARERGAAPTTESGS